MGHVAQARALHGDHAPAGVAQAGVEAENANRVRHAFAHWSAWRAINPEFIAGRRLLVAEFDVG